MIVSGTQPNCKSNSNSNANCHVGGLSHLVEAATALTSLVDSVEAIQGAREVTRSVVSDDDEDRRVKTTGKSKKREIFPQRLMEILSDATLSDVISWLPHGRSFVIIRPDIFTEQVLPRYLPPVDARTSTKYPSFTRKLNRWGFRQSTRGPDTGAFHHPLFRRDEPEVCQQMVCQKSRERKEQKGRSLPPKKRAVSRSKVDAVDTGSIAAQTSARELSKPTAIANVSSDERSVTSSGNFTNTSSSGSELSEAQLHSIPLGSNTDGTALPFISNDASFVAHALRQRDIAESLRAAKTMLYDAYMKALRENQS